MSLSHNMELNPRRVPVCLNNMDIWSCALLCQTYGQQQHWHENVFLRQKQISHHHWVLPRALIWLYSITPLCTQNGWDPFTIHMMLCSRADTKHCSTSFSWERISTENVSTGWNVWGDKIIDMDTVLSEGRIFFYFHTKPKSPVIIIIIIIRLCQGQKTGKAAALSELK